MSRFNQFGHAPVQLPLCGCFVIVSHERKWLPMINLDAHATILSSTSRTTLTQTFVNPHSDSSLDEVRYDFPLYDGVSVVGFTCAVGSRVIRGVVREREAAKKTFDDAVSRGETAGLLQQNARAADVFTTTLGNVPAGETVKVEITYLGELGHDAEADGVRWTLPTSIAPRYDGSPLAATRNKTAAGGKISITVDAEMADGCPITSIQSPSHPISVSIGKTSAASASANEPPSLRRASATLSLGSTELDKDFVVLVVAGGLGNPTALLETHPSGGRALMTTLVPRFNLPAGKPEVVFVCDRSGSMGVGEKIPNLVAALQIFLKSLPVGVRFNICSFGSQHSFLWDRSRLYDQDALDQAVAHVNTFGANFGGTEMYAPLDETFKKRYADMNLEVFLLTDGEIWEQEQLFTLINDNIERTKGAIRVFTLGIGEEASSSLLNGVARAGGGFAQRVAADEKLDKKVVRMLKGALTPHVSDYALEVKYEKSGADDGGDDGDFEIVEKVMDGLSIDIKDNGKAEPESKEPISLFSPDVKDEDLEMPDSSATIDAKFSGLPTVAHPRYLQAPFQIPALFPFSRTTVYILLSDSAPHREPTSVVLTGTSDHGPLRLEIPITKLAEKGATIHQLAARKAIQELEEGRGWIAHAKDPKGKLLKEAYEGRFQLLVQREAVRLGVEYQVGGKWCSFVAVQENSDKDKDKELGEFEVLHPEAAAGVPTMFAAAAAPKMRMATMARAGPVMASPFASRRSAPHPSPPPPAPTAAPRGASVALFGSSLAESASTPTPSAFGSAAPAGGFGGAGPGYGMEKKESSSYSLDLEYDDDDAFGCESEDMDDGAGLLDDTPAADAARSRILGSGTGNSLAALAALQTFIGSWAWSPELESIISVKQQQTSALQLPTVSGSASQGDVLATVCAVVFLKKRLASEKDAWELMVDKAERWLEDQTAVSAATLEEMVGAAGLI